MGWPPVLACASGDDVAQTRSEMLGLLLQRSQDATDSYLSRPLREVVVPEPGQAAVQNACDGIFEPHWDSICATL